MLFSSQCKFVDFSIWKFDALHRNLDKRQLFLKGIRFNALESHWKQLSFIWMSMQCIEFPYSIREFDALHIFLMNGPFFQHALSLIVYRNTMQCIIFLLKAIVFLSMSMQCIVYYTMHYIGFMYTIREFDAVHRITVESRRLFNGNPMHYIEFPLKRVGFSDP